jgi:hypothetical protein
MRERIERATATAMSMKVSGEEGMASVGGSMDGVGMAVEKREVLLIFTCV